MKLPKPKLEILKRRKKKKAQAKRKKAQAKELKSQAKKKKIQAKKKKVQVKKQKHRLLPRKDGRLERTKQYSATFYYIIMAGVGLVMLMVFLGII